MGDSEHYLDYLKKSRELALGSWIRQSLPFRIFRHIRLRNMRVQVDVLGRSNSDSQASEVCLLGVWSEEYPYGMPLEFLERDPIKWQAISKDNSPYGTALLSGEKDKLSVYSRHENLRLDFRMDNFGGIIRITAKNRSREIDLFALGNSILSIYPNQEGIEVINSPAGGEDVLAKSHAARTPPAFLKQKAFLPRDLLWIDEHRANPQPLSVNNPSWRGILSSTRELFNSIFLLSDELTSEQAEYYAALFAEAGLPSITIQGFPHTYIHLVRALRKLKADLQIHVIWHGNFLQMKEDYDWTGLNMVKALAQDGVVRKVGFVKQGMAEVMRTTGMPAYFIMNYVRRIPDAAAQPIPGGPHIGIWGEPDYGWRKPPYAMLAALSLVSGASAQVVNISPRSKEFGDWFHLNAQYHTRVIQRDEVLKILSEMHLNMYVTLSECAPMLPLKSLSLGVPCLLGPTSHYFRDHAYLHSRLVVPYPEHAEIIAEKANSVLAERERVIQAYRTFAVDYNQQAVQSISDFLEFPMADGSGAAPLVIENLLCLLRNPPDREGRLRCPTPPFRPPTAFSG